MLLDKSVSCPRCNGLGIVYRCERRESAFGCPCPDGTIIESCKGVTTRCFVCRPIDGDDLQRRIDQCIAKHGITREELVAIRRDRIRKNVNRRFRKAIVDLNVSARDFSEGMRRLSGECFKLDRLLKKGFQK